MTHLERRLSAVEQRKGCMTATYILNGREMVITMPALVKAIRAAQGTFIGPVVRAAPTVDRGR